MTIYRSEKKKKRILLSFLVIILLTIIFSFNVKIKADTISKVNDDPQQGREDGYLFDGFSEDRIITKKYNSSSYTHDSRFDGCNVRKGIDVSSHQGNINWGIVKTSGQVEFAFVRAGYRGYGTSGNMVTDTCFATNMKGASAAGIPTGIYFFSQATNVEEAKAEAQYVLNVIAGYDIELPVVLDFEYASDKTGNIGRLYNAKLSKTTQTRICEAFCEVIKNAGYTPMIYANKSMLESGLNASELSANYSIWLANYTTKTTYAGEYTYWQYSEDGNIAGINNSVDLDFWYDRGTVYNGVDYSAVFNADYYCSRYPDIKDAFGDNTQKMLEHFVKYGMSEARQGCESFNVKVYRNKNKDLRIAFGADWKSYYLHYNSYGKNEGRVTTGDDAITDGVTVYNGVDYSNIYNYQYYITKNPDIEKAFPDDDIQTLEHFVKYGMNEGRQASEEFNITSYRKRYADLRAAFGNDIKSYYLHYNNYGKTEGRVASGEVVMVGTTVYEGVDYSSIYDYNYYVTKHPDIYEAFGLDDEAVLEHFVKYGMSEARQGNEEFNVNIYYGNYEDLRNAFGTDWKAYYLHYNSYGKNEGRSAR